MNQEIMHNSYLD